jgi:peptidoglycan/xylan/chitin deacetylase (PgdA/CDA1 family)
MSPRVPILLYHRILAPGDADGSPLSVSIEEFREDMEELAARGWRCLPARRAAELALAGEGAARTFALTFDDGYRDFAELAHPVLHDLRFTATVFIATGRLGGTADWGAAPPAPLLGPDAIRTLSREGVGFGSHSSTHSRLTGLADDALRRELAGSRAALSDLLGRRVEEVAWPYGDSDGRVRTAAAAVGYRFGYGVAGGGPLLRRVGAAVRPAWRDRFDVPRREVRGGESRMRRRLRTGPADGVMVAVRKVRPGRRDRPVQGGLL